MALPQLNAPFVPDRAEVIRDAILADIRLEALKVGEEPAVGPGSDNWWFATAHAHAAMLQYSNIELSRDAITPLNATGADLENWRQALGLAEVEPSPASGKIRVTIESGTATIANDEQLLLPNGLRIKVTNGPYTSVVDGAEVDVIAIDTGEATNLGAGEPVRWVSAPTNVDDNAEVAGSEPLTGGFDKETDDRKRSRILNALANKPGGGNWGQARQIALDELQTVQDCFVYPAIGGPASVKIVPVRDFDEKHSEYTRELNSAALEVVRNAIHREFPDEVEVVIEAAADETTNVTLLVDIPDSALSGGDGSGWLDQTGVLWPILEAGDSNRVTVTAVTATNQITVSAATTTTPIAGQTHIAWWSPVDLKFRTYLVTAVSGATTAWNCTLDRPLVSDDGTPVAIGDYISPAAVNSEAYGVSWLHTMRELGCGENTEDANRTPRSLRHPFVADERPYSLTFQTLKAFQDRHREITDIEWGYRQKSSPTVPATVADPPNVLVPNHFGIYSQ